jgi:hypothetical protein
MNMRRTRSIVSLCGLAILAISVSTPAQAAGKGAGQRRPVHRTAKHATAKRDPKHKQRICHGSVGTTIFVAPCQRTHP